MLCVCFYNWTFVCSEEGKSSENIQRSVLKRMIIEKLHDLTASILFFVSN